MRLVLMAAALSLVPSTIHARPPAAAAASPAAEATAVLMASGAGWNAGKLDDFAAAYAPDATFVTADGLVQGRGAIADHYRPSFVNGTNKRGKLSFDVMGSRIVSRAHVLLWARWRLQPADAAAKPETGMTTLLFERRPEGWRIISDHSS
jgi:uncharacterized protein (TIGR02246 family)